MVETSLISRNKPLEQTTNITNSSSSTASFASSNTTRCGVLETRVRGSWYRVTVSLEIDYLSVTLDESCETNDHTTILNGTLGYVE